MEIVVDEVNSKELSLCIDKEDESNVIDGFMLRYDVSREEAMEIWSETKKWLWLCNESRTEKTQLNMMITEHLLMIDEMWHNFILYTKTYEKFCMDNFNRFIHHSPTSKSEKDNPDLDSFQEKLRNQLSYIFDKLGEDTVKKWYKVFPKKYSKENINSLKK